MIRTHDKLEKVSCLANLNYSVFKYLVHYHAVQRRMRSSCPSVERVGTKTLWLWIVKYIGRVS